MKKLSMILGLLFSMGFLGFAHADTPKTMCLNIKGLSCALCAAKVEANLKKLDGVTKCSVDDKTGKGSVEYTESKVNSEQILESCNKAGFKCDPC